MRYRIPLLCCAAALTAPHLLTAQATVVVTGKARSVAGGAPLAGATVTRRQDGRRTLVSREGNFRIAANEGDWLVIAQIGFAPDSARVVASTVTIQLRPAPIQLSPILAVTSPLSVERGSQELRDLDLALRPHESSQELLRLVPGLVIAQHGSGGKAEQIGRAHV